MAAVALPAHVDVAICGGGPVGSALALGLRSTGLVTLIVDDRPPGAPRDDRVIALAHGSRLMLEGLGIDWTALGATPIERIHVSHLGAPGRVVLRATDSGVPALGYVVSYARLCAAFDAALDAAAVSRVRETRVIRVAATTALAAIECRHGERTDLLTASVAVVADGARGLALPPGFAAMEHDYGQSAIVTEASTDTPHGGTAFERFTSNGPLALLPYGDRYSVVWTLPRAEADAWTARPDADVLAALQSEIGQRAGRLTALGPRSVFPLRLRVVRPNAAGRIALVGNAAQALHPVAGQGFNLGLRDAYTLAQALGAAPERALADAGPLARWRSARRIDRMESVAITHGLVALFGSGAPAVERARAAGLAVVDSLPLARRWLARRMMFGASR